jgi:precorrin-6A/cobalt-precorrin-6A reductase
MIASGDAMTRVLILGGTTEARLLAGHLAARPDLSVTVSLAGRTTQIVDQNAATRIGGFGGAAGLAAYLRSEGIDALIDATHPYAAAISANAVDAVKVTGTPFLALRRPAWIAVPGDQWTEVDDMDDAVAALGPIPQRVFLALGRREIGAFERAPQHFYLVRSVDPIAPPPTFPHAVYVVARGPFSEAGDRALLETERIDVIVSRNSGGDAAYGKIAAARALGIGMIMARRPKLPEADTVETVADAIKWLDHVGTRSTHRGA